MRAKKQNFWLTSDIRLRKDSQGYYDAEHKYAGTLLDWHPFADRAEARRAAVEELKRLKDEDAAR